MTNSPLYNLFYNNELINIKMFDNKKIFVLIFLIILLVIVIQSGLILFIKKLINYFLHFKHLNENMSSSSISSILLIISEKLKELFVFN